ncbi:MAG TPA: zinc ribbon domain-containing protein [Vicinamibacterales bacterium]|nr:zinc ribbon domain-containing protein [Vicinamibacterales bacterium]
MPLFEYRCDGCDHHFELLVRQSTKLECPKCASTQVTKQLSVFAVSVPSGGASREFGPAPCGSCGDPRGPGSCSNN